MLTRIVRPSPALQAFLQPVRRGDRATCFLRDADVIITAWSDGRIPWPRCKVPGRRGGSGLLVEEELARAVRCEAARALCSWWGITAETSWRWRQALGVARLNEGSRLLHAQVVAAAGRKLRGRKVPPEACERRRRTARELNLGQYLRPGALPEKLWKAAELALLGTLPLEMVARRTGRTPGAVRQKREELGIPNPTGNRWGSEEIALLGTLHDEEVGRRLGRSRSAVTQKRIDLGIPLACDRRREGNRA
jgi:hypothetical protein